VTLSHTKIFVLTVTGDVFCHILLEKRHSLAPPVQNFFEREEMSAGTETCFSRPVSDLSLISEA